MMVKIDVTRLSLYYDKVKVLHSINMIFTPKSVTALIGPSGCGKTSFLRSLNRLNDTVPGVKVEGKIELDGIDVYKGMDEIELRKKVGMVFQKPNPFPMSIYDNIAYGAKVHGVRNKKILDQIVERSLKQAFLWDEVKDRLNKSALSLSGGQQQRLCIARALAVEPEVILMDEPTSSLDPVATSKIEELILKLKEEYTVIIVTHSMQQAARISDFTGFFLLGNLVEYKETKELFKNPEDDRTKGYINGVFG